MINNYFEDGVFEHFRHLNLFIVSILLKIVPFFNWILGGLLFWSTLPC
jgi:hypothetical protein